MTFRLATWNVNSLKVRLPHLLTWLGQAQPDVEVPAGMRFDAIGLPEA